MSPLPSTSALPYFQNGFCSTIHARTEAELRGQEREAVKNTGGGAGGRSAGFPAASSHLRAFAPGLAALQGGGFRVVPKGLSEFLTARE
jgi:hypothetical protein